ASTSNSLPQLVNSPTITLTPSTLPNGTVGASYSQTITASGGTAPYSFVVTAGMLPPGLVLSSGGVLSGTPTTAGTSTFTVTATDANGNSGSKTYAITISAATKITSVWLGTVSKFFSVDANWLNGVVPGADDTAVIDKNAVRDPTVDANYAGR